MKRILLLITITLTGQYLLAADNPHAFTHIDSPEVHIKAERKIAITEGKLLLWVLGGSWCHDSQSLAAKLATPELKPIIDEHYRLSTISVEYLNAGFEYMQVADMTTFYATPTVLIINPESMQQVNKSDMHIWANADLVPLIDTIAYFKKYSEYKFNESEELTESQKQQLGLLTKFRKEQERRIRESYLVVGPLLEEYKQGIKNPEFDKSWIALAKLRMALPDILQKNREAILKKSQAELDLSSDTLKPLPWETDL